MKTVFASALLLSLISTPAFAREAAPAEPAAVNASAANNELPFTPRFAAAVTAYRNCVMEAVDAGTLADHRAMATSAMESCAVARGQVAAQLAADIQATNPSYTPVAASSTAATGVSEIEPMIEEAAIERAHAKYAQSMI